MLKNLTVAGMRLILTFFPSLFSDVMDVLHKFVREMLLDSPYIKIEA